MMLYELHVFQDRTSTKIQRPRAFKSQEGPLEENQCVLLFSVFKTTLLNIRHRIDSCEMWSPLHFLLHIEVVDRHIA